jgi:hypothetical protein
MEEQDLILPSISSFLPNWKINSGCWMNSIYLIPSCDVICEPELHLHGLSVSCCFHAVLLWVLHSLLSVNSSTWAVVRELSPLSSGLAEIEAAQSC